MVIVNGQLYLRLDMRLIMNEKLKQQKTYRGVSMGFEGKLSEIYNKIANEIDGMIPVEWEKVYTIAYVNDRGGRSF